MEMPRNTVPSASTSMAGWCGTKSSVLLKISRSNVDQWFESIPANGPWRNADIRSGTGAETFYQGPCQSRSKFSKLYRKAVTASTQSEHVLHIKQAIGAPRKEAGGAQRPEGKGCPAAGLVGNLHPFAGTGEQHRVVAHNVAAAHRGEADGGRIALPGHAFAAV